MNQTTSIYYDTQDPQNPGWAWRHGGSSGPVDGDLGEDASLDEVLDQACGSDVPLELADPSLWRPIQGAKGRKEGSRRTITASVTPEGCAKMKANWIYRARV